MNDYCPGAVQSPQPGGVTLDRTLPPRFVWHITWDALDANGHQPDMAAVGNYLIGKEWCPHIMWNPFTGEMIQYYPASVGSRALMYNDQDGAACVQVEAFFTPGCIVDGVKYETVADTPLKGFDTLLAWADSLGVPRAWPMGAPQWQGNARDVGIWNGNAGHYGHCHSPGDTHTDPGPMPSLSRGAVTPESSTITPEGFLMALTDAQQQLIYDRAKSYLDAPVSAVPGKVWSETVFRGGQNISVKSELAGARNDVQAINPYVHSLVTAAVTQILGKSVTVDPAAVQAAVTKAVASVPAPGVDPAAIAKAVNDDAAARRQNWK